MLNDFFYFFEQIKINKFNKPLQLTHFVFKRFALVELVTSILVINPRRAVHRSAKRNASMPSAPDPMFALALRITLSEMAHVHGVNRPAPKAASTVSAVSRAIVNVTRVIRKSSHIVACQHAKRNA